MSLRDIVSVVVTRPEEDVATPYAVSLASLVGAHLTGAVVQQDVAPMTLVSELPKKLLEAMAQEGQAARDRAAERFLGTCSAAGVPAETVGIGGGARRIARAFGLLARHFDLSIVAQGGDETEAPDAEILSAAIFESARPSLVVPRVQREPARLDHVLVAWDGSEVATRALAGALPLLRVAKAVQVITIPASGANKDAVDWPGFNITRHLARHDIRAELKVAPTTIDTGNTLLSLAADAGADLLVMGAYGHSRLRDLVLGGATQMILRSMTLPVLMAH